MHSALEAAAASFVVGLVIVAAVVPFRRRRLRAAAAPAGRAVVVVVRAVLAAAFLVADVAAHAVPRDRRRAGLGLPGGRDDDRRVVHRPVRLGPSGRHAGIVLAVHRRRGGHRRGRDRRGRRAGCLVPAVACSVCCSRAGAASAVQQAANGQLGMAADDVVVAVFVNFVGRDAGADHRGVVATASSRSTRGRIAVALPRRAARVDLHPGRSRHGPDARRAAVRSRCGGWSAARARSSSTLRGRSPAPTLAGRDGHRRGASRSLGVWLSGRTPRDDADQRGPPT